MKRETRNLKPHAAIRTGVWFLLLLVVAAAAWIVVERHQTRIRGVPRDFPPPVTEADVPTLGVNVALEQYTDQERDAVLARLADDGFVWLRQTFYWSQIKDSGWEPVECILDAVARYPQLRLVVVLDDDPPAPPERPERFASFASQFASRYGDQIDYYQIWDEPNLSQHWGGAPANPRAYADLLARAAWAIRDADPEARILLAGLAPTIESGERNLSDIRFLERLYQTGVGPYFDIVVGKPYGFDTGPDDRRVDDSLLNVSRLLLLREVMVEHGDEGKAIWASHWGWNALPEGWEGAPSIWGQTDEATQAARTVATLERARAEWPWVGAMILEHFQPAVPDDDPRWGFALVGPDDEPRPVYDAVVEWATGLPDAASVGGYPARNRWASYGDGWRVGPLGADVPVVTDLMDLSESSTTTFRFEGSSVALTVQRGPYRGFLYLTVDGEPANALLRDDKGRAYVVLYDEEPSFATVPLATGLAPGVHTVEVVAEGSQGQWPLIDWRVGAAPVRDGSIWKLIGLGATGLALLTLLVRDGRRVDWAALAEIFLAWPEWAQTTLIIGLTGLFWAAVALLPIPYSLLPAALPLLVLALLFSWRPDLGLTLIAFAAPFYLIPDRMVYRALSLPEVLVVLTLVGHVGNAKRAGLHVSKWASLQVSRWRSLDGGVVLLTVAAVIATLTANDRLAALFDLRAIFLLPALYYALLRRARIDEKARWRLMDGFVLGSVGVALVGLMQVALGRNLVLAEGGLSRLQSVYHSPNNVALYLGRTWPFLVAVALWGAKARRRRLYALAMAPVTLALGLSFSRGALLLALPAALLAMGWCAGGRWRWKALALVLIGALALIPLLHLPRFASLFDLRGGSTFFRLHLWRSSLRIARDHPWFGVGPGNFLDAYRTRYVLPAAWQEFNLEHPHNIYLDHWTRLGLLGVLAGALIQVAFWRRIGHRGRRDPLALGLVGSMAALLAHGLVDNALFFPDLALSFFLLLALAERR